MLGKLADYYESDLERQLKQLQATLRPLAIVAIGGLVLLIGIQTIGSLLNVLPR
jgi:type II secretory pathway component PulF